MRLSFEFGKAAAAIVPSRSSDDPTSASGPSPGDRELQYVIASKVKLDANIEQEVEELNSTTRVRLTARGPDREELDTQIADIRNRIELLKAMSANYEGLIGFVRTANAGPDRTAS